MISIPLQHSIPSFCVQLCLQASKASNLCYFSDERMNASGLDSDGIHELLPYAKQRCKLQPCRRTGAFWERKRFTRAPPACCCWCDLLTESKDLPGLLQNGSFLCLVFDGDFPEGESEHGKNELSIDFTADCRDLWMQILKEFGRNVPGEIA